MEATTSVECYVALDVESASKNDDDLMLLEGHGRTIIKRFGVGISEDGRNSARSITTDKSRDVTRLRGANLNLRPTEGHTTLDNMASSTGISSNRVSAVNARATLAKTTMNLRKHSSKKAEIVVKKPPEESRGYNFRLVQIGSLTIGSWKRGGSNVNNVEDSNKRKAKGTQSRSKRRR